jgi:hypothetical protein
MGDHPEATGRTTVPMVARRGAAGVSEGELFSLSLELPPAGSGGGARGVVALRFAVRVVNNGAHGAEVTNPYEGLSVELADEGGRPVALPSPARAAKTGRWSQALDVRQHYVRLEGMALDGAALLAEQRLAERFPVDVGSVLVLDLAVERVRTAPEATDAQAIGAGPYALRVTVPLAWQGRAGRHTVVFRSDHPVVATAS